MNEGGLGTVSPAGKPPEGPGRYFSPKIESSLISFFRLNLPSL